MAGPATEGRFPKTDKNHPGWRWQVYPDASSSTGYIRKIYDPTDSSNGGQPTPFYQPYDFQSDVEDATAAEAKSQQRAARSAGDDADIKAERDAYYKQHKAELDLDYGNRAADRTSREQVAAGQNKSQAQVAAAGNKARMAELDKRIAEDKYQFDTQFGLDKDKLGADLLKTQSSLRGAGDLVQGWAFAQGVNDTGLSPYVQAVRSGNPVAFGGGTARPGNPAPATLGSMANSMSGQSYGVDPATGRPLLPPDKQSFVNDVSAQVQGGLANKPLGYFENMTDGQRKGFFSADAYNGNDEEADQTYYNRSRPGQRSAMAG